MVLSIVAVIIGLAVLVWSADKFVEGAAAVARHLGMAPLVIGMVIIGFALRLRKWLSRPLHLLMATLL